MKMNSKNILEATPAEIKNFAVNFLGLDIEADDTDTSIFAKVQAAHPSEIIFVQEETAAADQAGDPPPPVAGATEPAPNGAQAQGLAGGLGRDDPKFTILINNEERDGEVYSRDKEVGVNGRVWQLKRGVPIAIPARVFYALKSAVRDSITHNKDTGEQHSVLVESVPYNVIDMPSPAELAAWHERVDAAFCP